MNEITIRTLCAINNDFYKIHGASFASTRKTAWYGWSQCLNIIDSKLLINSKEYDPNCFSVLDFACGNMRFMSFLSRSKQDIAFNFYSVDNSAVLALENPESVVSDKISMPIHLNLDIIKTLIVDKSGDKLLEQLRQLLPSDGCNLTVCFGFMHHVPDQELRKAIMLALIKSTSRGGIIIVSFWQFLNDVSIAKKTRQQKAQAIANISAHYSEKYATTASQLANDLQAELNENDFLLGWQNQDNAWRYCHSFSDEEIHELVVSTNSEAKLLNTFSADGSTGNLNRYLVLQRRNRKLSMPKETKAAKRQRGELIVKRLSDIYPTKGQCLLNHSDAFTLVIAVLLSAQTTDAAVNKVTGELFSHWPDPQSMALAKATDIEAVIRSIGFYRVKAANCIKLSQILLAEHNGKVPSSMSELVKLPGVGRKTANIVLNVAFGIVDGIAVDTHVFRIAHRLGFSTKKHSTPEKVEHDLMDFFEKKNWGTINHQWVLFGREFCDARRPQCAKCPIGDLCPKKI